MDDLLSVVTLQLETTPDEEPILTASTGQVPTPSQPSTISTA